MILPRTFIVTLCLLAAEVSHANPIDFSHDVLPLLRAHCVKCHANGNYKGGLSIDTREALLQSESVELGNGAASPLVHLLKETKDADRMPQKADPLPVESIAILETWISEGLVWEKGFTFKESTWVAPLAPRRPILPAVGSLGSHPIDRFVSAYFTENKLAPSGPLSDRAFYRRVALDLLGLLPDPDAVDAFAENTSPNKRRLLIDRLLNQSVNYADHWITFWNDLLRNDYKGTGFIDGGRKQITEWLYQSLVENKPYNVFVRELISPTEASEGFIKGIKWRGNVNASQRREVQFAQNLSQVFLGENMKCASCHDSFINDWKLTDAYGLAAIVADEPLEIHHCDKPTGKYAKTQFPFPELGDIDATKPKSERLKQTAALMTSPKNGRFARTIVNRLWQRLLGRGVVEPVDMMSSEPWNADLLDYLAVHLIDSNYDLKKTIALITSAQTYQSHTVGRHVGPKEEYRFRGPIAKRLTAEQFIDALWKITGQAPAKVAAKGADKGDRGFVRASLVHSSYLMRALGRPNREQVVTVRPEDLSTLQALELNNGKDFTELLDKGASSLLERFPESTASTLIIEVYRQALSRDPTPDELTHVGSLFEGPPQPETVADLLWMIFLLPEFQLLP